jgi:hypothetical protein
MKPSDLLKFYLACVVMIAACGKVDHGGVEGGIDASSLCFGTNPVTVCLQDAPTAPLTISSATMLDTENSSLCTKTTNGLSYCVLAGTAISIGAPLRATGRQPLVLVSSDSISITAYGMIDVGSHRGVSPEAGAGADPMTCVAGTSPASGSGGAGGSFTGRGGQGGGHGNTPDSAGGGEAGQVASMVTELRGGCPGQDGGGAGAGLGGHGGGVVHLIAAHTIDVGGVINASGEGGDGDGISCNSYLGGGGGGAGGMIGFDAPAVTSSNLILASGGGGGAGCYGSSPARAGEDPMTIAAAHGGTIVGVSNSAIGRGGDGSSAVLDGPGMGGTSNLGFSAGGGGGGGGAGLIKAPPTASLGTQVSPPPTP